MKMAHHFSIKTNFSLPREISMISTVQDEPLYRNKVFLQQKYLSEGLSARQIAREIFSARSTVSASLIEFGIEPAGRFRGFKGQLGFGERLVKGRIVPHKGEKAVIDQMASMREAGASYGRIASWLNQNNVRTKNRVKGWDRPTVFKILKKNENNILSSDRF
jgi:IS30 family transposase